MALSDEDKEEFRAELTEARRILKEDSVLAHNKRMDERWTRVHGADPEPTGPPADPGNPDQPPAPDPKPDEPDKPKKKGLWWGNALD